MTDTDQATAAHLAAARERYKSLDSRMFVELSGRMPHESVRPATDAAIRLVLPELESVYAGYLAAKEERDPLAQRVADLEVELQLQRASETADETAKLTADVVLFSVRDGIPHVLVIRRGWPPFEGCWALPGGHVDAGEDTAHAAMRELAEETGIQVNAVTYAGVYAKPGRDPRGRYVTFAYTATADGLPDPKAGDDASEASWIPADALLDDGVLAFDHAEILFYALGLAGLAPKPTPRPEAWSDTVRGPA